MALDEEFEIFREGIRTHRHLLDPQDRAALDKLFAQCSTRYEAEEYVKEHFAEFSHGTRERLIGWFASAEEEEQEPDEELKDEASASFRQLWADVDVMVENLGREQIAEGTVSMVCELLNDMLGRSYEPWMVNHVLAMKGIAVIPEIRVKRRGSSG